MKVSDIKNTYAFHIVSPTRVMEAELSESKQAYNVVDIEARTLEGSFRAMFDGTFMYSQSNEGCAICKEIWNIIDSYGLRRFKPETEDERYINLINLS